MDAFVEESTYSPAAILHLFNNAINVRETKKLVLLRGVFQPGKGQVYSGYCYDSLRDETSDAQLTILVPPLIRKEMVAGKTVTVNGYVTRRVVNMGSRIDVQLTVTDLVAQTAGRYSGEELKAVEVLQAKAAKGYRDVHSWIKQRVIHEQPFKIAVVVGRTAIIDSDIRHQLRESIGFYDLDFHRVNLTSEAEILGILSTLEEQGTDIIAISRGGGDNLDIFNRAALAERCIRLSALFITAIGHKDDVTLLQKVADKAFITPSELGQFLNDLYNHTLDELQHSKARLVAAIREQLEGNYRQQVDQLKEQLKAVEGLKEANISGLKQVHDDRIAALSQVQGRELSVLQLQIATLQQEARSKENLLVNYKRQLAQRQQSPSGSANWKAIVIAIIVGIIIGLLLHRR